MADPLDAYSQVVTSVAAELLPKVAGVRTRQGSGSAVVFTADGFLLTNAHVVGSARSGTVSFADGSSGEFEVVGRDPLSDLAVIRAQAATPRPPSWARATLSWWGSSSSPSATRSDSPGR
ncbi:Serine protease [[Actinomadura] parvosata subsp. kistnae]|nr:Serine protease [Actinomadura parvosata subsp. kistnae]